MTYCSCSYIPSFNKRPPAEDRVTDLIKFAAKNLNLDLSGYKESILNAMYSDNCEFTYLGPGIVKSIKNTGKRPLIYNCVLKLFSEEYYFLADTNFDSRVREEKVSYGNNGNPGII